jgi:hypothetical protein
MNQTMTLAKIALFANHFRVIGPDDLINNMMLIRTLPAGLQDQMQEQFEKLFSNWYVNCAISGEPIPLVDLRYWDVEKQEVYARPELVPALGWYVPIPAQT